MIRTFLLGLLMTLFVSCGGDSTENSDPTPGPPTPPAKDVISFPDGTTPAPVFAAEGGETTVSFTASGAWTAVATNTRADGWCRVSPAEGAAGAAVLTIAADPNAAPDERSAVIVLSSGQTQERFAVVQKQQDALIVTQSRFEVGTSGGVIEIEVKANVDFDYTLGDDAVEWISLKGTRALETSRLVFAVAANDNTARREGTITIGSGVLAETVTVYQAGAEPSIVLTQSNYTVGAEGETIRVEVSSNVDVEVLIPEAAWITESRTRAMSTHTYYFEVAANDTYEARTGQIYLVNQADGLSECVIVTQVQRDALVIAAPSYTLGNAGGRITIEAGHNVDFDVETDADWIMRITSRAYVTDRIVFQIDKNLERADREGTIAFVSKNRRLRQEVKVFQTGTAEERAFLEKLYKDTGGDNWYRHDNWCTDKPIDEWYGVSYADGELSLNLGVNYLSGKIDLSDCTTLVSLNCQNSDLVSVDLSGCTALRELICNNNLKMNSLKLTGCTSLVRLECQWCQLGVLDVADCTALQRFDCSSNQIQTLNLAGKKMLTYLDCGRNRIGALDFSDCKALASLNINSNGFTSLDLSSLPSLEILECDDNRLTGLQVAGNAKLTTLSCGSNRFTALDVSDCTSLNYLFCDHGSLISLNVGNCPELRQLECSNNGVTKLDVSGCPKLAELRCLYDTNLTYINAAGCAALTWLGCYDSDLERVNLSGCTGLSVLRVMNNRLTKLDLSDCVSLTEVFCSSNFLSALDVSNCLILGTLICADNSIERLDVSGLAALTRLLVEQNKLSELKFAGCTSLETISCEDNELSDLDLSGLSQLTELTCARNGMKSLNASGCRWLRRLNCSENALTTLDLTGCNELFALACSDNKLPDLDLDDCRELCNLNCERNRIKREIPEWFRQLSNFTYDIRYSYANHSPETVWYTDNGVGWWYPGEPEKRYHGW